jgi:HEPN domain-containing protein
MKASRAEARRWLRQAESDLAFAELGAREGFPAQACFMAQQAAQKASKAVRYAAGERFVIGHSLVELLEGIPAGPFDRERLRESARRRAHRGPRRVAPRRGDSPPGRRCRFPALVLEVTTGGRSVPGSGLRSRRQGLPE